MAYRCSNPGCRSNAEGADATKFYFIRYDRDLTKVTISKDGTCVNEEPLDSEEGEEVTCRACGCVAEYIGE